MMMTTFLYACLLIIISERMVPVVKEKIPFALFLLLEGLCMAVIYFWGHEILLWACMLAIVLLYLLFYGETYTYLKSLALLESCLFVCCVIVLSWLSARSLFALVYGGLLYIGTGVLRKKKAIQLLLFALLLGLCIVCAMQASTHIAEGVLLCVLIMQESIETQLLQRYHQNSTAFQNQVMMHHYEEVKNVYLNMRGWRHDYHNHIQSMKAYLSIQEYDQLEHYLNELEEDLRDVDHLVKSGNLMIDAILNSKLSLAQKQHITITCKAHALADMQIRDIDLCVILGNLLDNALEACAKIEETQRFMRIYLDIVQAQFYASIMNSAVEESSFQARNYISEKRGEHGYGMKRVALTVAKYDGYLNLKNEPGVFVSEVMLPINA